MYNFLASHRDKFLSGLLSVLITEFLKRMQGTNKTVCFRNIDNYNNQEKKKRESIFLQLQKFSGGGGEGGGFPL